MPSAILQIPSSWSSWEGAGACRQLASDFATIWSAEFVVKGLGVSHAHLLCIKNILTEHRPKQLVTYNQISTPITHVTRSTYHRSEIASLFANYIRMLFGQLIVLVISDHWLLLIQVVNNVALIKLFFNPTSTLFNFTRMQPLWVKLKCGCSSPNHWSAQT